MMNQESIQFSPKKTGLFIALFWTLVCLIQALFTELHPDEAYYWVFSQNLDWGQFHQPPMIAIFIKIGYSIFHNELGVRLMTVLTNLIGLILIFKLSGAKKPLHFALIAFSLFLVHAGSLLAVPDSPLVFFTILFIYLLSKIDRRPSLIQSLLLGLVAACMLYSKYHAVVFLGISSIVFYRLWRHPNMWLVPLIAIALYTPHILWQIDHDWVSFRFHLFNREKLAYDPQWMLEFLISQTALLLPLIIALYLSNFRFSSLTDFQKKLFVIALLFFAFLWLLSLRNNVEGNWSALLYPCLLIATVVQIDQLSINRLVLISSLPIAIFAFLRLEIMFGFLSPPKDLNFKYAYYKNWSKTIQKKANGRPVVFNNSYQLPSIYMFYSGEMSHSLNTSLYPGNQFDLYDFSLALNGQDVLEMNNQADLCQEVYQYNNEIIAFRHIPNYQSYHGLWIDLELPEKASKNSEINTQLTFSNLFPKHSINWKSRGNIDPGIAFTWIREKDLKLLHFTDILMTDQLMTEKLSIAIPTPKNPGKYLLSCGISGVTYFPCRNSHLYKVEIE